jgi:hypothetical protein
MPLTARGQSTNAAREAEAFKKFKAGAAAAKAGDCQRALVLLEESQRLSPKINALLNMALCEEKLGQLAKAVKHLKQALYQLSAKDDRWTEVSTRLADLSERVPRLRIKLAPDASKDIRVKLDDVELTETRIDDVFDVDPGPHVIVEVLPGNAERRHTVHLVEKQQMVVTVGGAKPAPPPVVVEEPPNTGMKVAGYIVMGLGGASTVASAVTGLMALDKYGDADPLCPNEMCSKAGLIKRQDGDIFATATFVTLGGGLALVGIGTVLVLGSRGGTRSGSSVSLHIAPQRGGAFVGVGGSF